MSENGARDLQTEVPHRLVDPSIVKRCTATARSGQPCRAHPLAGSTLCSLHTPGLASERGRRGGLNRRRPVPQPKTIHDLAVERGTVVPQTESGPMNVPAPMEPMDAHQVRVYLEKLTRSVAAGRLDPVLARAATTAAAQWLKAIALDEKNAQLEKRLAALEKAAGPEMAS